MAFPEARPTTYRGVSMRSRLEARFAAYLDDSETSWEYEPRAFADQTGQYLPDFLVTVDGHSYYVEVRPTIDRALLAFEQMSIIRASEPEALLIVWVPWIGLYTQYRAGDPWRWTVHREPTAA